MTTYDEILDDYTSKRENALPTQNNDNASLKPLPVVQQPAVKAQPQEKNQGKPTLTTADILRILEPHKPPTKEELEKEKKRHNASLALDVLGEGLSAMANLAFTTQYSPNMYEPKNITGRNKVRYDRLMQNHRDNAYAYANMLAKIKQNEASQNEKIQDRDDRIRMFLHDLAYKEGKDKQKQEADAAAAKQKQENWQKEFNAKQSYYKERNKIYQDILFHY